MIGIVCEASLPHYVYENFYPMIIKKLNFRPFFVFMNTTKEMEFDLDKTLYEKIIVCRDDDLSPLKEFSFLIPYEEEDVSITESLCYSLNLRCNPFSLLDIRRNKYQMMKRVKQSGIRYIKTKNCINIQDVIEFTQEHKFDKYVTKPYNSSGSSGVYICDSYKDLEFHFLENINKMNKSELLNDSLIVQEFIKGEEYVVNCVSRDGVHKVASIWKYEKLSNLMYRTTTLVAPEEIPNNLVSYVFKVLDALDIKNSASHAEVKIDETGPVLIEVGARVDGGDNNSFAEVIGYTHFEALLKSLISDELFSSVPEMYQVKEGHKLIIFELNSLHDGYIWNNVYKLKLLENLKTCRDLKIFYNEGAQICKTTDLMSILGRIYLLSDNDTDVQEDLKFIEEWEKTFIYL